MIMLFVLQQAYLGNHVCNALMTIMTHPPFVRLMRKQVEAEVLACLMLYSFFPSTKSHKLCTLKAQKLYVTVTVALSIILPMGSDQLPSNRHRLMVPPS